VILHAPVVQPRKGAPRPSLACTISATPSRQALVKNQYHDVPLTACPVYHQPVLKNVFTILPRGSGQHEGSVLCYGDPFDLTHKLGGQHEPLYVTSPVGSALHSGRESRRQEVLLKPHSTSHSAWRLQPSDPHLRLTYEGQSVEVGARVMMIQTMTNQPMVIEEEFSTRTIFGQEQQVSVGVVTRATTRAASTIAFLTWTRRTPRQGSPQGDSDSQKEPLEEDVLQGEREKQEELREREKEKEEEQKLLEERVEGLRLVLDDVENNDDVEER
ncbi:hypothetical protein OTU49_011657, partial [Cherax quadricarinatus]